MCLCVDTAPVVAFAIVLLHFQRDSEGVEVAIGQTGQRRVPRVHRAGGTAKGCGETVQDTTDLDGKGKQQQQNFTG